MAALGSTAFLSLQTACSSKPSEDPGRKAIRSELLHYSSLRDVARRIQAREISSVELTNRMLDRIAAVDPTLKSYATVMREQALEAATRAEEEIRGGTYRGPLHGVPVAVKDLCYTKGVRTMAGTRVYASFVPDYDATAVVKLTQAGAVLLGKLNLTEGAMIGYNPVRDIPVNPWRGDVWAGASSSGSGVATAAGLCYGSLGTDTGGSIRAPSAANGIVGLKPTYGRVSRYGVFPLAESLDHVGPMARRVGDTAVIFEAIAGFDPNDPTSLREPASRMLEDLEKGVRGLRVGFDRRYASEGIHPEQSASIETAVGVLRQLGADIIDVQMPDVRDVQAMWFILCSREAAAAHAVNFPSREDQYGPYFRDFLKMGREVTDTDHARARQFRSDFSAKFNGLLSTIDALVCPSRAGGVFSISQEAQYGSMADFNAAAGKFRRSYKPELASNFPFTVPADLAGTPTITLPSGFSTDNLPFSVQFMGQRLSEPMLCRIGHAYEEATGWYKRHPSV